MDEIKKCTKCERELGINDFPEIKSRGKYRRSARCRKCVAEYKHQHYVENKERYKKRSKKWKENNAERDKENKEKYYEENREILAEKKRAYTRRPEVRERSNQRFREYRKDPSFLEKERARGKLNKRLKSGKITKPSRCERCGDEGYVEGHHEDYSKPLEVLWLCKKCHENIHHSNERDVS